MAMRPLFAASLLGLSLILSTGCGSTTPPPTDTQTSVQTPQPTQTVAITDEKPVPTTPEEPAARPDAPQPMKRPEIARIKKDPFVNPFAKYEGPKPVVPSDRQNPNKDDQAPTGPATVNGDATVAGSDKPVIEPPEFEVRGLVRGNQGMVALLNVEDKTRIVSNGQMVGEYRISSIDNRGVTVTRSGQKFRVKMKNEFGL